jgi:hypothetical protein
MPQSQSAILHWLDDTTVHALQTHVMGAYYDTKAKLISPNSVMKLCIIFNNIFQQILHIYYIFVVTQN